jgi:NADPH:quinone reductase-like Zn-dependent oxidoreductase
MRALRLKTFGKPADLLVENVETPVPTADEVLVRIAAASVNMSDVKNVQGLMHQTRLPRTPGRDFAGTVTAGRSDLMGAEVWGTGGDIGFTRDGSHGEFLLIPANGAVLRPAALSAQSAACCGVTFVTAASGLAEAACGPGQTVVIIGVFGGVGRAAAQIARSRGARVVGIARSVPPASLPASLAGSDFIDSSKQDAVEAVRQLTAGRGGDIVFDTVGGAMLLDGLKMLAMRGRIIEITAGRDPNVTINIRDFYHQQARLIGVDSLALDVIQCASLLRGLAEGFASGALVPPPIAATYSLLDAPRAYEAVENGRGEGRHVIMPGQ